MTRAGPVTLQEVRATALARYERHAARWATGSGDAPSPALDVPLHPPTEVDALADPAFAVRWVSQWREVDGVVWQRRRWASVGDQDVPVRLCLDEPADLARFVGRHRHWDTLAARAAAIVDRWGDVIRPVVRRHARVIVEHDDADAARLLAAVTWLVDYPDSGLYLRQLPIEGLSTKWIEGRRAVVSGLVTAITGRNGLGLAEPPGLVRVRVLDDALVAPGPRDVTAPVPELDAWELRPRHVVVVENLQTFLAIPPLPGVIVIHGSGYAADVIGSIRWARCARVIYWGDLDRDGFAILDRVRAHCDDVRSLLMDEATLLAHRHLWTEDPTRDTNAVLPRLTRGEQRTYCLLRELGGVRLEQERLAWPACVAALENAVGNGQSH